MNLHSRPAILISLVAASVLLLAGCFAPSEAGAGIHLTKNDIAPSQMDILSRIDLADQPLVSLNDIVSYDASTHELRLMAEAFARIAPLQVPVSGKSFVVCVDGNPVYWGAFWTLISSLSFIGIGAGASSRMGDWFWLNTFSVPEYTRVAGNGGPPALATRLNDGDRMAYWLFWRCYDTAIDSARFRTLFGRDMPLGVRAALALMRTAALARREGDTTRLTDRGAYLFHLVEQTYTHAYLEPLWAACRKKAWPDTVRL